MDPIQQQILAQLLEHVERRYQEYLAENHLPNVPINRYHYISATLIAFETTPMKWEEARALAIHYLRRELDVATRETAEQILYFVSEE